MLIRTLGCVLGGIRSPCGNGHTAYIAEVTSNRNWEASLSPSSWIETRWKWKPQGPGSWLNIFVSPKPRSLILWTPDKPQLAATMLWFDHVYICQMKIWTELMPIENIFRVMQSRHAGVDKSNILSMTCLFRCTQHTCGTAVYSDWCNAHN